MDDVDVPLQGPLEAIRFAADVAAVLPLLKVHRLHVPLEVPRIPENLATGL